MRSNVHPPIPPPRRPPPPPTSIRVSEAVFTSLEHEYVDRVLRSGRLSQGPVVAQFEDELKNRCAVPHAVACNTGTAALHLAMIAAGVGPNSIVIVPALTYVATANAAAYLGATVMFADVLPSTWCMDPDSVRGIIDGLRRVAGIARPPIVVVPVDLYDACADLAPYDNLGVPVIVDASHSMRSWPATNPGVAAVTHSYFPSKLITTGEGGAVLTAFPKSADLMRLHRGQGAPSVGVYHHTVIGHNYRMTEIAAAIGLAQLTKLDEFIAHRRRLIARYRKILIPAGFGTQDPIAQSSGWAMAVTLPACFLEDEHQTVDTVREKMLAAGVETRPFFKPLNTLPIAAYRHPLTRTPVAADLYRRGIVLPTHTLMTEADVEIVCTALREATGG